MPVTCMLHTYSTSSTILNTRHCEDLFLQCVCALIKTRVHERVQVYSLSSVTLPGYQLLTLSRDHTLRVWPVSEQLSAAMGATASETERAESEMSTVEGNFSSQMEMDTTFVDTQVEHTRTQHTHTHTHTHTHAHTTDHRPYTHTDINQWSTELSP